jgi:hypothetical protein
VINDTPYSLNHPYQGASLLGLPFAPSMQALVLAWDIDTICQAWLECIRALPLAVLLTPTPSRTRSIRNLAINVFVPVSLLERAWSQGSFPWPGNPLLHLSGEQHLAEYESTIEAANPSRDTLVRFSEQIKLSWSVFIEDHGKEFASFSPVVTTPRGELQYERLLESQRLHAAQHFRQVTSFLLTAGYEVPTPFRAEALKGLDLPATIF